MDYHDHSNIVRIFASWNKSWIIYFQIADRPETFQNYTSKLFKIRQSILYHNFILNSHIRFSRLHICLQYIYPDRQIVRKFTVSVRKRCRMIWKSSKLIILGPCYEYSKFKWALFVNGNTVFLFEKLFFKRNLQNSIFVWLIILTFCLFFS